MKKKFVLTGVVLTSAVFIFCAGCAKEETTAPSSPTNSILPTNGLPTNSPNAVSVREKNEVEIVELKTNSVPGISGKIILKGSPPPERNIAMEPACSALHKEPTKTRFYVVGKDGALADVFIYIKQGLAGKTVPLSDSSVLLDQVGCEYVPPVVGLQTRQKLMVRNSDPLMHNVNVLPKVTGNKPSNKAQMAKAPDLTHAFDKPELFLTFKCDIHPWMYAYVCVVEHPFFAVSAPDGTFALKNVPAGKYVIEAVHRKAGKQTKEITIADGETQSLNFIFEIPGA